jgi:hypothetical protein
MREEIGQDNIKMDLKETWTVFIWLRIRTSGGLV